MLPAFSAAPPDAAPGPPPASGRQGKVELDLDGAPFLQEEAPPAALAAPKKERAEAGKEPEKKPAKSRKKLLLILGPLLLLGLAAAAYFLFFSGKKDERDLPPEATVITVPSTPFAGAAPADQFIIDTPPFWVELKDQAGEARLLRVTIRIPTEHNDNVMEFNAKKLIIRDALFYYLTNKDYAFLSDNRNLDVIKRDMTSIINEYLTTEKIKEVLLADFIIR